jgi:SAM-dependent methyltransferase/DNA-binding transcriptional ArsR family regulator
MDTTDSHATGAAPPIKATAAKPAPAWLARRATVASEAVQALGRRLVPAPASLMTMTVGYQLTSRAISAAAELGIADHLAARPRTLAELAAATSAELAALGRLLRLLELAGIVRTRRDGRVELTRLGAPLRGDHPESLRDWCRYLGADWHWELWSGLDTSVRDGRTAYAHRFQTDFFGWFGERPDEAATFDAAMRSFSSLVDGPVAAVCHLRDARTILDVAGGSGALLAELLRANPQVEGTLFDQADVLGRAKEDGPLLAEGLRSRVSFVPGDMFDEIPDGRDVYVMKWILHDWADEQAAAILARIARAMRPGARLLLAEMLIEPGRANGPARQLDLAMLVLTGGRERTADEFRTLLDAAGFDLRAVRRTASPMFVLDATRR